MVDELGIEAELDRIVPEAHRSYIKFDRDALRRDLEADDIWYMELDGQTLVFNSHI